MAKSREVLVVASGQLVPLALTLSVLDTMLQVLCSKAVRVVEQLPLSSVCIYDTPRSINRPKIRAPFPTPLLLADRFMETIQSTMSSEARSLRSSSPCHVTLWSSDSLGPPFHAAYFLFLVSLNLRSNL